MIILGWIIGHVGYVGYVGYFGSFCDFVHQTDGLPFVAVTRRYSLHSLLTVKRVKGQRQKVRRYHFRRRVDSHWLDNDSRCTNWPKPREMAASAIRQSLTFRYVALNIAYKIQVSMRVMLWAVPFDSQLSTNGTCGEVKDSGATTVNSTLPKARLHSQQVFFRLRASR